MKGVKVYFILNRERPKLSHWWIFSAVLWMLCTSIHAEKASNFTDYANDPLVRSKASLIKTYVTINSDSQEVLIRLIHMLDYLRTREKNTDNLYPPLPDPDCNHLNVTDIAGRTISMALAETVRDLDNPKQEAYDALNVFLSDALEGTVPDLSPLDALSAFNLTVFETYVDVIPEPTLQRDFLLNQLIGALKHKDERVRFRAEVLLYGYAFLVPDAKDRIINAILEAFENKTLEGIERTLASRSAYTVPLTFSYYKLLKKKSLLDLANDALLLENDSKVLAYQDLIRLQIQDGDLVSDRVRLIILNGLRYLEYYKSPLLYSWIRFFPDLLPTNKLIDEQKRTRDSILNLLENEVDTAPVGESVLWISVLLHSNIATNITQYRRDTLFYGSEQVVRILNKILYKEIMNETTYCLRRTEEGFRKDWNDVRNDSILIATKTLCMLKDLGNDRLEKAVRDMLDDFLNSLAEKHPEWTSQEWFLNNSDPRFGRTDCHDDALLYYALFTNGLNGAGTCEDLGVMVKRYIGMPLFVR